MPYQQPAPSPIEIAFWEAAKPKIPELEREVWIGKHRVDFFVRSHKVIIELKGYKYHGSKEQFTRDAGRERHLQKQGYRLISFAGSEVYKDPAKCVNEVLDFLRSLPTEPGTTPFGRPISPTTISSVTSSRFINPPISFQSPQVKTLNVAPARQVKLTARKRRTILRMEKWQMGVLVILGALVIIAALVLLAVILKSVSV